MASGVIAPCYRNRCTFIAVHTTARIRGLPARLACLEED